MALDRRGDFVHHEDPSTCGGGAGGGLRLARKVVDACGVASCFGGKHFEAIQRSQTRRNRGKGI